MANDSLLRGYWESQTYCYLSGTMPGLAWVFDTPHLTKSYERHTMAAFHAIPPLLFLSCHAPFPENNGYHSETGETGISSNAGNAPEVNFIAPPEDSDPASFWEEVDYGFEVHAFDKDGDMRSLDLSYQNIDSISFSMADADYDGGDNYSFIEELPLGATSIVATGFDLSGHTGESKVPVDVFSCDPYQESALIHWTFNANDITGNTVKDLSGYANNGYLEDDLGQASDISITDGHYFEAMDLSQEGTLLVGSASTVVSTGFLSALVWIRANTETLGSAQGPILSVEKGEDVLLSLAIELYIDKLALKWALSSEGNLHEFVLDEWTTCISSEGWTHMALLVDANELQASVYCSAEKISHVDLGGYTEIIDPDWGYSIITLGANASSTMGTNKDREYFQGYLDDFVFITDNLSQEQLSAFSNSLSGFCTELPQ